MELSEAIKLLKEGVVNSVGNEITGMAESPKEYTQAVNKALQALEELQVEKNHLLLVDLLNEKKISNEENRRCMLLAIENNDLKEKLANSIRKDKIKEKIEELKEVADEDNMDEFVKINLLEELLKGE